jgi:hypothetical protein
MIEKIILDHLRTSTGLPVCMELPPGGTEPPFLLLERTGGSKEEHISQAAVAVQSYGSSLLQAAQTNEAAKAAMEDLAALPEIAAVTLNADYNYTDTAKKRYRYQAVFQIYYYQEGES